MRNKRSKKIKLRKVKNLTLESILISILIALIVLIIRHYEPQIKEFIYNTFGIGEGPVISYNIGEIPEYNGKPYVVINDNKPNFNEEDYYKEFEIYSKLDYLGRCRSCICKYNKKNYAGKWYEKRKHNFSHTIRMEE